MVVKHGIRRIELHSEDALFYGRKLGSFEVNHEAIVDLFAAVKKFPGVRQVAIDFFACSTVKSALKTVKSMSEIMALDEKQPGYVETGLETVSPRLVQNIMPGKVKSYTIEEWPDVIDDALGILDDNYCFTVASMMTDLQALSWLNKQRRAKDTKDTPQRGLDRRLYLLSNT